MRSLRQALATYPLPWLEGLALYVGLPLTVRTAKDAAAELAAHLLRPDIAQALYEGLSARAREALAEILSASVPIPWATFVRRYGPVRDMGPQRLMREQPWREPISPAEELYYRGVVYRALVRQDGAVVEIVYVPKELTLLLPQPPESASLKDIPMVAPPEQVSTAGQTLLNDVVMVLAFAYNEGLHVDWEGRPLRGDLARLGERLTSPLQPTDLLRLPPRVQFILYLVYHLGFVTQEGDRLRLQVSRLQEWLKQPVAYHRLMLWRLWAEGETWCDLCHVPELDPVEGTWVDTALRARQRILRHLRELSAETWYALSDVQRFIHQHDPDFLRPDGNYETWLIRRREDKRILRGFQYWQDVEGALLRFYVFGPMFWMDAVMIGEEGRRFALTDAGARWLRRRSEPMRRVRPPLHVSPDFRISMSHNVHPLDLFRVTRFADWELTRPEYVFRITRSSLQRASRQGILGRHILLYLRKATRDRLPQNVYRALRKVP